MDIFKKAKENKQQPKWINDKLVVQGKIHQWVKDQQEHSRNCRVPNPPEKIHHTDTSSIQGSAFQGHVVELASKDQVVPTMNKLFSNHKVARATHNIYAYRISGQQGTVIENFDDDGEHGAGRKILKLLRESNVVNKMVVVTRWYGGTHMGPHRFTCIQDIARKALQYLHPLDTPTAHPSSFNKALPTPVQNNQKWPSVPRNTQPTSAHPPQQKSTFGHQIQPLLQNYTNWPQRQPPPHLTYPQNFGRPYTGSNSVNSFPNPMMFSNAFSTPPPQLPWQPWS